MLAGRWPVGDARRLICHRCAAPGLQPAVPQEGQGRAVTNYGQACGLLAAGQAAGQWAQLGHRGSHDGHLVI